MRILIASLVVLLLVALVASQERITDFNEYMRKKAEYEAQKKKYDEFQSLSNVPVVPGYDLIPKIPDSQAPPGRAEPLLPNYDGMKVIFRQSIEPGPGMVEPGNTAQNYFHDGPIPAKKSISHSKPVIIPTVAGQDFVVAADSGDATSTPVESAPAPVPAPIAAFPDVPNAAPAQQAIFFGQGALPVQQLQADAPFEASASLAPAPAPLRPLSQQFQFAPSLPHSDFHPGPVRNVASIFQPAFVPPPVAVLRTLPFRPAERYGEPGAFIRR